MGGGGRWLWVKKNDKENSENTKKKKSTKTKQKADFWWTKVGILGIRLFQHIGFTACLALLV